MQISSTNDTNDNNMKNSSDCAKHLQNTILYHNTDTAIFPTRAYHDKKQQEKRLLVPEH